MQSSKRIQNGYFSARHFICMGDEAAASAFICSFLEYEKFLKMKVVQKPMCVYHEKRKKNTHACDASIWRLYRLYPDICVYIFVWAYLRVCVFDHNLAVHETTHIFLVWILNVKNTHLYVLKNESMIWTTPLYIILKCIFKQIQ